MEREHMEIPYELTRVRVIPRREKEWDYCTICGMHADWHDTDTPRPATLSTDDLCPTDIMEIDVVPMMTAEWWSHWWENTDRSAGMWKQIWSEWVIFVTEEGGQSG